MLIDLKGVFKNTRMSLEVGIIVEGKIVKTTNFGAFVELTGGRTGLIHISEITHSYVKDVKDFLHENDTVTAKVVAIKPDGKIDLSLKQLEEPKQEEVRPPRPSRSYERREGGESFERMMKDFLKSSEEKLGDIKRNLEGKRT
nr:S1 RNA-binding domain-containing protein [Candidatus Aquicultor secundus]